MKTIAYIHNDIGLKHSAFKQVLELFKKYFPEVKAYEKPVKTFLNLNVLVFDEDLNFPAGNTIILNLDKSIKIPNNFCTSTTGTYIPVNMSRTVDINGKYVGHLLDWNTERIGLGRHKKRLFIIYDSDLVAGFGVKKLEKQILDAEPDAKVIILSSFQVEKNEEFVDLSDLTQKGIVLAGTDGKIRIPYLQNEFFLEKHVSIPREHYFEFKKAYLDIINPTDKNIRLRVKAMHEWAQQEKRKTFVIGVSGGIDSAVCLALLLKMKKEYPKENYIVIPVIAPIHHSMGTSEQDEATKLGHEVCNKLRIQPKVVSLQAVSHAKTQWVVGNFTDKNLIQQSDYWLRPMAFHSEAEREGVVNSCMVGTVNYAEWQLGWMSQFLDVFNLMPIIDLHKSEVYECAKALDIPESVITIPPKGGLADKQIDEEALGFTYKEFESYSNNEIQRNSVRNLIKKRISESEYKRKRFNLDYVFAIKNLMEK